MDRGKNAFYEEDKQAPGLYGQVKEYKKKHLCFPTPVNAIRIQIADHVAKLPQCKINTSTICDSLNQIKKQKDKELKSI